MYESLGFTTLTAPQAVVFLGLGLGVLFGVLAQLTAFCLRRALVGEDRRQAAGIWVMALAVAVLGTQGAVAAGLIGFDAHRFMAADLPVAAIVLGGLMFGAGMVLTRGCVSRLTVLAGSGNLRAALVLVLFAIIAHATLKGVLAPLRTALGSVTLPLGEVTGLAALPGGPLVWSALVVLAALAIVWHSGARPLPLAGAALIGALVPLGWVGTGFVLFDDFDPVAMESLSFTAPGSEALFWTIASSAVRPTFGVGLIGGVLAGALVAALIRGQFRWQSFEGPAQTGRYMGGGALMGMGGVLAGGCTVGAGLSGVPTLSFAALLALAAMAAGALVMNRVLSPAARRGDSDTSLQPAE